MNSKERMSKTVNFEKPDRIPLTIEIPMETILQKADSELIEIADYLNSIPMESSMAFLYDKIKNKEKLRRKEKTWKDEWGCLWKEEMAGEYGTVTEHPLADWNQYEDYKFPDLMPKYNGPLPDDKYHIRSGAEIYGVLWYRLQFLRGYDAINMDLAADIPKVLLLHDKIIEIRIAYLKKLFEYYPNVNAIHFGDCWGMQQSLMISPRQWREIFKPAYRQLFDVVHQAGAKVVFQSDGYTFDIIDDLIEIGVDVLRISVGMMNIAELGKKIRGKVCLWADPCRQHIIPSGTPKDVRRHIHSLIDTFATPEGGFIAGMYMGPDVPPANVKAAYDTYLKYGKVS